jgi:hypothetical protein
MYNKQNDIMSSILSKFKRTNTDEKEGLIKQSIESVFRPKPRMRYIDTLLQFPSKSYITPPNSGVSPVPIPQPDLLYVVEGYVEDGYI